MPRTSNNSLTRYLKLNCSTCCNNIVHCIMDIVEPIGVHHGWNHTVNALIHAPSIQYSCMKITHLYKVCIIQIFMSKISFTN